MIVVARSLSSKVIAVVAAPIPPFSVVVVVATPRVSFVETSKAVIPSGRLLGYSGVLSNELFCVVGIDVIFGHGEEFGDCGWPLAQ